MTFSTRLIAAWGVLTGDGGSAVTCSFCGKNSRHVEQIIATAWNTSICNRCLFVCYHALIDHAGAPGLRRLAHGEHETSLTINLSHDEVVLAASERIALDEVLRALVAELPESRLVSWSYFHGSDRFDLLTIEIVNASGLQATEMSRLANDGWRRMRDAFLRAHQAPANGEPQPLSERAHALKRAATDYVAAVSYAAGITIR